MTAPTLTDLIYIKKGFLNDEQCQTIIDEYHNSPSDPVGEHCPHAFTGDDTWSTFTRTNPRQGSKAFSLIHRSVEKMVIDYQDYLDTFNSFHVMRRVSLMYPHMYRIMKYETGTWIHPHVDHDPHVYGSCTINLNDEYTGGEFAFWGGKHKVKLEKGDAMIWPADYFWVHEVETIESGERYSVNCFLRSIPQELENAKFNVHVPQNIQQFLHSGETKWAVGNHQTPKKHTPIKIR